MRIEWVLWCILKIDWKLLIPGSQGSGRRECNACQRGFCGGSFWGTYFLPVDKLTDTCFTCEVHICAFWRTAKTVLNHVLLFHCVKRSISVYLLLLNSFYLLFQSTVLKCGKSCLFCVAEQCLCIAHTGFTETYSVSVRVPSPQHQSPCHCHVRGRGTLGTAQYC